MDLDLMWNSFQKYKASWEIYYNRLQPPVNVHVPYLSGEGVVGEVLSCTMGEWTGEPDSYVYQWKRDSDDVTGTGDTYLIADVDAGHSITCVVTATNEKGSTEAPPSNPVLVAETEVKEATHTPPVRRAEPARAGPPTRR